MSTATKENPAHVKTAKVEKVKVASVPSFTKLAKKAAKHVAKCKDCKQADNDLRADERFGLGERNISPPSKFHVVCEKGMKHIKRLHARVLDLEKAPK